MKKPCIGKCTTTSLAADLICRGCGMTDYTRLHWSVFSDKQKLIEIVLCEYRLKHYDECVKSVRRETDDL